MRLFGAALLSLIVQNRHGGAAEDSLLLILGNREFLDRRDRPLDRTEEMRLVAAHQQMIDAYEVSRHPQLV